MRYVWRGLRDGSNKFERESRELNELTRILRAEMAALTKHRCSAGEFFLGSSPYRVGEFDES
jgi:hypothetical protein